MKFNFSPFPTLTTNRLIIRETTLDDLHEVHFLRSDKIVNKYIAPSDYATDAADFIKKVDKSIQEGITISWSIQLKEDPTMIGSICLWNFNGEKNSAEVGYALHPDFQKQGIMSEALERTMQYGFVDLKLDMIDAFTHQNNKSSIRLLSDHGFEENKNRIDEKVKENLIYERFRN